FQCAQYNTRTKHPFYRGEPLSLECFARSYCLAMPGGSMAAERDRRVFLSDVREESDMIALLEKQNIFLLQTLEEADYGKIFQPDTALAQLINDKLPSQSGIEAKPLNVDDDRRSQINLRERFLE